MKNLCLFPNQLFEPTLLKQQGFLPTETTIYFIEDPLYYGNRKGSMVVETLQLNQLRILYMRVTHQRYLKTLKTAGYKTIVYSIDSLWKQSLDYTSLPNEAFFFDPCDHVLTKKLPSTWKQLDSPSFLMSNDQLTQFRSKYAKRFQHHVFYKFVKQQLKLLESTPSQDKLNREPFRSSIPSPPSPFQHLFSSVQEWKTALAWLQRTEFIKNPKPSMEWNVLISSYLVHLPVCSSDVHDWLEDFVRYRFHSFGAYQDVVISSNPLLYHSGLSIYLNNGLITPKEVLSRLSKVKTKIQNYEGFVRQLIGWREYCILYYRYIDSYHLNRNIFQMRKKKLTKDWYEGTTSNSLINQTIQYAFNYGYLNHIQRLMVMSNYMTLSNLHPDALYQWMFEFSLDSYEWVMVFNTYSMGSWSDGGWGMRKPYISSANYILTMSDTPSGNWIQDWNRLFQTFVKKQTDVLKHTPLAHLTHVRT